MMAERKAQAQKRWSRGALVGLGAFGLAFLIHHLGILQPLEWKSWDLRLRLFSEPGRASRDIFIFLIDQYSLDVYEKEQGLTWPWPRQLYSAVVDYLKTAGARAVFFDLTFTESSPYGVEDDENFAAAIVRAGNAFLPLALSQKDEFFEEAPATLLERFAITPASLPQKFFPDAVSASLPVPALLEACRGAGNVLFRPDTDGIFRRLPLAHRFSGLSIPSVPLALARFLGREKELSRIPVDGEGRLIIRYHGPAGTYTSFSLAAIINSWARLEEGLEPQVRPEEFAGKIVFVGASAAGLLDLRPTPLSPVYPGVEIQATVLDNILSRDFIRIQPRLLFVLLLFVFSLLTAVGASLVRKIWLQVVFFFICLALPFAAAWPAFVAGVWLEFVVPEFAVMSGFIAASLLNYGVEGKQRRFIKGVFSHYLSPEVIDRIIDNPSLLRLGGERREVTSFFSDVAGFTAISEALSPEELVNFLNEYLSEMTEIILESGGTLDKYEGDAIIAFWNAPLDQPDHALRACRAALRCQARLSELGPRFREKAGRPVTMRIGLSSGPAVVGNMGSSRRFDYTAMGDTVNLASRLEGACKLYRVPILASEETYCQAQDVVMAREVDTIRVVGRARPVNVYEIVREKDRASAEEVSRLKRFAEAREAYKSRAWDNAMELFGQIEADPLAALYLARLKSLRENPPPEDWDGVFVLKEK
ncbi:MAG: adenylate/guanylate cyclase domain-containing protein [Clostridiales bacterium]|nr:adenylate/guanylate cyclase domain-containing protein [Clostridiales bacterium]